MVRFATFHVEAARRQLPAP